MALLLGALLAAAGVASMWYGLGRAAPLHARLERQEEDLGRLRLSIDRLVAAMEDALERQRHVDAALAEAQDLAEARLAQIEELRGQLERQAAPVAPEEAATAQVGAAAAAPQEPVPAAAADRVVREQTWFEDGLRMFQRALARPRGEVPAAERVKWLDGLAREVEREGGQPLAIAALRAALADAYERELAWAAAAGHHEAALEILAAQLPPAHEQVIAARAASARCLARSGKLEAAVARQRQLLEALAASGDARATDRAREDLLALLRARGPSDEAVSLARDMYERASRSQRGTQRFDREATRRLADVLLERGSFAEAEPLYRAVAQSDAERHGLDHAATIASEVGVLRALAGAGRPDDALHQDLMGAVQFLRTMRRPPRCAELGLYLFERGELDAAEPWLREAWEGVAERDPVSGQAALRGLIGVHEARGDTDRAAEWRARLLGP
jgi:hypothetical protein